MYKEPIALQTCLATQKVLQIRINNSENITHLLQNVYVDDRDRLELLRQLEVQLEQGDERCEQSQI